MTNRTEKQAGLSEDPFVMTVGGPIAPAALGFTLPHEHVLVDFVGADQIGPGRYEIEEVLRAVLPFMVQVKGLGCQALVECTPAYLGRDPVLLRQLSAQSGLALLTNTGYCGAAGDRFVPRHAYEESADQLCERWVREWEEGIDDTGVRPGFIKIGVDGSPLSEIDTKLVRAAARTHLRTGMAIAAHTAEGAAALQELGILREEGVSGNAWIWVHAQLEQDRGIHVKAAAQGAWLEFDGVAPQSIEEHLLLLADMKQGGLLGQVMVSHDAGWYCPGEADGGVFRGFDTMFTEFLPALRRAGFSEDEVRQLTVENPGKAFTIGARKR